MSILDSVLGQISGASGGIAGIAEKVGISPEMAEKAVAALGNSHEAVGDTVSMAAEKTGISPDILQNIMGSIGGEGGLGAIASSLKDNPQIASVFSMIDKDGDGNPINDLTDMAKGLFGKE